MQFISLSQTPAQTFHMVIGEQNCTISVYWKQIRLYMDLRVDDIQICTGAICPNKASVVQSPSINFAGSLHFWDFEGDTAPTFDLLMDINSGVNGRYGLFYVEPGEEIPAALLY